MQSETQHLASQSKPLAGDPKRDVLYPYIPTHLHTELRRNHVVQLLGNLESLNFRVPGLVSKGLGIGVRVQGYGLSLGP